MKFIVGGSNGIFSVDNGKKHKIHAGHIYGVTFSEKHIYYVQRISNGTSIVKMDKGTNKKVYAHRVPGGSVHQAYFDTVTGHLFVTITRTDQLLEFDVDARKEITRHKWATGAEHHMNSVWRNPADGKMYVYEHNIEGFRKTFTGGVHRLSPDFKPEKTWKIANKGHNLMILDNYLWVVNSFDEGLCRMNLTTEKIEIVIETKEYPSHAPRGLAVSDDYILMGMTELASRRDRNNTKEGLIVVYDRQFNKVEEHKIAAGQMYEVRFLDRVDYAHNGIVFDA